MKRILLFVSLMLLLSFPFQLLATASSGVTDVHIGLASNFSEISDSASNPFSNYFRDGIQLALKDFKSQLDAKKIRVVLDEFDYGKSDIRVIDAAKRAVASRVVAVIGYNWSSQALIAAPIHHEGMLPMLSPSAAADRLGTIGRFIHLGIFNNKIIGSRLAQAAFMKVKAKTVAIVVAEDCAYCHDLADAFSKEYLRLGGKLVLREAVAAMQTDFSVVASNVKAAHPDAVLIPNYELISASIMAALVNGGTSVPFLGGDGWGEIADELVKMVTSKKISTYSVTNWHEDCMYSGNGKFIQKYVSKFGKKPNITSALAYDSMSILIKSILAAQRFDREGIEDALNQMTEFNGVTGRFRYRAVNHAPEKSQVLLRVNVGKSRSIQLMNSKL